MNLAKHKVIFIGLTLLIAFSGCDRKSSVSKIITCDVSLGAPQAGRIDITRFDPNPKLPPIDQYQIFWSIPSSSPSIQLIAGYGNKLVPLNVAIAARAQFTPPEGAIPDKYSAEVSISNEKVVNFNNSDFNVGQDQVDIVFDIEKTGGKAIIDAINKKNAIKIILMNNGKKIYSGEFYLDQTKSRDEVYLQAKNLVENSDPKYCHEM